MARQRILGVVALLGLLLGSESPSAAAEAAVRLVPPRASERVYVPQKPGLMGKEVLRLYPGAELVQYDGRPVARQPGEIVIIYREQAPLEQRGSSPSSSTSAA